MRVKVSNTVNVENPSDDFTAWCKENLTIPNPEYAKKIRMHFWLGNTPKVLTLYETRGNALVLPFGTLRSLAPLLQGCPVESDFSPPEKVEYGEDVPLYDYQETAVKAAMDAHYGIIQSPAGSGKTQMGIALVKKFGRKALWLTHTRVLLNQSRSRAEQYMGKSLIGTITEGKVNIGKGITFATIQTMCRLDLAQYKDLWDVIVVDECFPENTMVQTPHGEIPIQYVLPGELVVTRNEFTGRMELCEVEELQVRSINGDLVKVTLENGKEIVCTSNHPFYTQDGYKKAGDLTNVDEVRVLQKGFRYFDMEPNPTIRAKKRRKIAALLQRMFEKSKGCKFDLDGGTARNRETGDDKAKSRNRIRTDEAQQSHGEPCYEGKSVTTLASNEAQTTFTRRERTRVDHSSTNIKQGVDEISTSNRVCCPNEIAQRGLSLPLQNRHSATSTEDCNRGGRRLSLLSKSADARCEEDGILAEIRVESVEVLKRGCDGKFSGMCENGRVYNLSVHHNHNYFANGVLVHNCHRVAGTPTAMTQFYKVLNSLSARHKYGLSATVHRADGMITAAYAQLGHVVHTVPEEAVGDKIMKVGIKPIGTTTKLTRECLNTDGTLNYTSLISYLCSDNERNQIISAWIQAEETRSCLILSDRLDHLETLMELLPLPMRIQAVMISGKMTTKKGKAERERAIEDMRQGKMKYLFATYSLAREGLDIPCLERLFLTTPQKDYAVITQSIGRIARICEGKQAPIALDFVDSIPYLYKSYKKRCATYRKNGCYFVEEGEKNGN